MDEIISRDENFVTVGAGVSPDSDLDISMLRVDPVTNYLLIDIAGTPSGSGNTGSIATRDQNHVPVCLAYDESNDELVEVLTDENGYLLCDVEFV